jgi:hypothetical protein
MVISSSEGDAMLRALARALKTRNGKTSCPKFTGALQRPSGVTRLEKAK